MLFSLCWALVGSGRVRLAAAKMTKTAKDRLGFVENFLLSGTYRYLPYGYNFTHLLMDLFFDTWAQETRLPRGRYGAYGTVGTGT